MEGSRLHRDQRQVLEPVLRLHEAVQLGDRARGFRSCTTQIIWARSLSSSCSLIRHRQPLVGIELVEDLTDQRLDLRVVEVAPVGAARQDQYSFPTGLISADWIEQRARTVVTVDLDFTTPERRSRSASSSPSP
jgi:hypothetical protein